ncbi:hypothetical protein [Cystobacter fuscus]|uniref:hypothetical protein n=1 Tax=Cystobacter fuscus TaxID=43 RepID=UPI0037BEEDF1
MKKDPRLEFQQPWELRRLAEVAQADADVRALHPDSEWSTLVAPLVRLVRRLAAGETMLVAPPVPSGLSPALATPWKTLTSMLLSGEFHGSTEKEVRVLVERLCVALAADPGLGLAEWLRLSQELDRVDGGIIFLDQLTLDLLRAHEQELQILPAHTSPLELLSTHGPLSEPGVGERYLGEFSERERASTDRWDWLTQVKRATDCFFQDPLRRQVHLLDRLGGRHWLQFMRALPHTLLRVASLYWTLQSPDVAHEMVELSIEEAVDGEPVHEEVLVLLVQHTFKLWNHIHRNLVEAASGRFLVDSESPESIERARAAEKDWRERELPERAQALAGCLLRRGAKDTGLKVGALALRHLFVRTHQEPYREPESETTPIIRAALVQGFATSGRSLSEIVSAILGTQTIKPALLSAACVVEDLSSFSELERVEQAERIWNAYGQQLETEDYFLNGPLEADEQQLALALGSMLARQLAPETNFAARFVSVRRPAEGWKADYSQFLRTIQNVLHLLIVGAMASTYCKQRGQSGQALFRLVWDKLHSWLRTPLPGTTDDNVQRALAHVWARLWVMEGPTATGMALAALRRLDHLEWLLLVAKNLRDNMARFGGPNRLPTELQEVIWSRFERMFPVLKLKRAVTPEQAARYERDAIELTPDVRRSSGSG